MLDEPTRAAILRLRMEGHGTRTIGKVLGVSRGAVKDVLEAGTAAVPALRRSELAEPHRTEILELIASCRGSLVRVHEELALRGATLSYQALTAYCRRHSLAEPASMPAGRYDHAPGEEMQHDTSPHRARIGGKERPIQTASLVLCHCWMIFAQCYPRFSRFECKVFLTDGLEYFGGACGRCMVDNTHVIIWSGTGKDMVPAPEMEAFGKRFGFTFEAHEVGDANRSGKVERPFDYIENNFLAGREFADFVDLNARLRIWCDEVNAKHRKRLHASPRELFVRERAAMKPLPLHVPEVYALHHRIVDLEGYVNLHLNRYSAPYQLIGHQLEIRETKNEVILFDGPRIVGTYRRELEGAGICATTASHRPKRGQGVFRKAASKDEMKIAARSPRAAEYVALMKKRGRGSVRDLRWLWRMIEDYPLDAFAAALEEALSFGMVDLERLERMVLRRVDRDFFVLPRRPDGEQEDDG
ncbi:MAG: transposase [Deltaproteobacteria bacterium]